VLKRGKPGIEAENALRPGCRRACAEIRVAATGSELRICHPFFASGGYLLGALVTPQVVPRTRRAQVGVARVSRARAYKNAATQSAGGAGKAGEDGEGLAVEGGHVRAAGRAEANDDFGLAVAVQVDGRHTNTTCEAAVVGLETAQRALIGAADNGDSRSPRV